MHYQNSNGIKHPTTASPDAVELFEQIRANYLEFCSPAKIDFQCNRIWQETLNLRMKLLQRGFKIETIHGIEKGEIPIPKAKEPTKAVIQSIMSPDLQTRNEERMRSEASIHTIPIGTIVVKEYESDTPDIVGKIEKIVNEDSETYQIKCYNTHQQTWSPAYGKVATVEDIDAQIKRVTEQVKAKWMKDYDKKYIDMLLDWRNEINK